MRGACVSERCVRERWRVGVCGVDAAGHLVRLTKGVASRRAHSEDNCNCVFTGDSLRPLWRLLDTDC